MGNRSVVACALASVLSIAACAAEPVPDTIGDIVGTWRYIPADPDAGPIEERQVAWFAADGAYEIRDARGVQTGRYAIEGRDVTITATTGAWVTTSFAATPDRLIVDAMFPDGDCDGLVGTWRGAQASNLASAEVTLELRADGSARLEQTGPAAEDLPGTWADIAPYAVITFAGTTFAKPFPALPDVAIGEWLYERVP